MRVKHLRHQRCAYNYTIVTLCADLWGVCHTLVSFAPTRLIWFTARRGDAVRGMRYLLPGMLLLLIACGADDGLTALPSATPDPPSLLNAQHPPCDSIYNHTRSGYA